MKHVAIPMLPDDFGIGQVTVARFAMESSAAVMREHAEPAFTKARYVPQMWRTCCRNIYRRAQREYAHAKAVHDFHARIQQ